MVNSVCYYKQQYSRKYFIGPSWKNAGKNFFIVNIIVLVKPIQNRYRYNIYIHKQTCPYIPFQFTSKYYAKLKSWIELSLEIDRVFWIPTFKINPLNAAHRCLTNKLSLIEYFGRFVYYTVTLLGTETRSRHDKI